jgi:hypothetical protein
MRILQETDLTPMDIASDVFDAQQIAQVTRQDTNECIEFTHRMEHETRVVYIDYKSKIYRIPSYVTLEKALEQVIGKFQPLEYVNTLQGYVDTPNQLLNETWDTIYELYDAVQLIVMPYIS